jgi:peptidoglycan/LPS O-acetylase OafA/YrhL
VAYYASFSRTTAWITALPAWLLGCAIAQMVAAGRLPTLPGSIWWWRLAAVLLSIPPKALVYKSISPVFIGNPATLTLFSLFVFVWLIKEISVFSLKPPPAILEWGGRWSYSLYLVHHIIIIAFLHVSNTMPQFVRWPLRLIAVFAASYAFYLAVERPGHLLARAVARQLKRPRDAKAAPGMTTLFVSQ